MIEENAVLTAQFWKKLDSLRDPSGLGESDFDQFVLVMIGLFLLADAPHFPNELRIKARSLLNKIRSRPQNEIRSLDESEYRSEWRDVLDLLANLIHSKDFKESIVGRSVSSRVWLTVFELIEDSVRFTSDRYELLLSYFDEVFHRFVSRISRMPYRGDDAIAALANHLSTPFSRIAELFPLTGEFAVQKRKLLNPHSFAGIQVLARLPPFLKLRLSFYQIDYCDIERLEEKYFKEEIPRLLEREFVLICNPNQKTTDLRESIYDWSNTLSSLASLHYLTRNRVNFEFALVIVPGLDRTNSGMRRRLREEIFQESKLIAVIDLQVTGRPGSKSLSAWLISSRKPSVHQKVLMLAPFVLKDSDHFRDMKDLMSFAASVVALAARDSVSIDYFESVNKSGSSHQQSLLSRYFKDGYRDIAGLCRLVDLDEILYSGFKLTAKSYLEDKYDKQVFSSLLDSDVILGQLDRNGYKNTRVYVIGNNGEGKSILLRDLAGRILGLGLKVLGVSFGLTDRFHSLKPQHSSNYLYLGARSSQNGVSLSRMTSDLMRMVHDIHLDPVRLDLFIEVLDLLGFVGRRYLVPTKLDSLFDGHSNQYANLVRLSEDVRENREAFKGLSLSKYSLGLIRGDGQTSICMFVELSSGEQQLLTLILKLLANADDRSTVLIDEPEISLHVSWQRAIPQILELISERLECSIVVATHSPVVISSATSKGDFCYAARDNKLIELPRSERRSVESALFDGFETYTENNRQIHERCAAIISNAIELLNRDSSFPPEQIPRTTTSQVNETDETSVDTSISNAREELLRMQEVLKKIHGSKPLSFDRDMKLIGQAILALNELAGMVNEA